MIVIRSQKSRRRWIYTYDNGIVMQHTVFDNGAQSGVFPSHEFDTLSAVRTSLRGDDEIIHDDGEL